MSLVAEFGDAIQTHEEVTSLEWKLRDFFSLSDKVGDCYLSPAFCFAGLQWRLKLYPNGVRSECSGSVSLYFMPEKACPLITVSYSLCIKGSGEKRSGERTFLNKDDWGYNNFYSRSDLKKKKSQLVPNNVLTVTFDLRSNILKADGVASSNRALKVIRNMKTILSEGKRADFTLKLGDRKWPVHKVILESRCEYFENMFRHEWVENSTGEVEFEDIEEDALDGVLNFIYTGDVEKMSVSNVCEIYVASRKFLLDDLRTLCIHWMKENMCVDIFCKVLIIADTYKEEGLNERAIEYFNRGAGKILDSEEWKKLKKSHVSIVADLLEETKKREIKKQRKE